MEYSQTMDKFNIWEADLHENLTLERNLVLCYTSIIDLLLLFMDNNLFIFREVVYM